MIPAEMDFQSDSDILCDPSDRQRALTLALAHERDRIVRFCARYTGSADAAEDLAQETMIEAWRHAERLRAQDGIGFWLTAIAQRLPALARAPAAAAGSADDYGTQRP